MDRETSSYGDVIVTKVKSNLSHRNTDLTSLTAEGDSIALAVQPIGKNRERENLTENDLTNVTLSALTVLSSFTSNDESDLHSFTEIVDTAPFPAAVHSTEQISNYRILAILTLFLFLPIGCYTWFRSRAIEQHQEDEKKLRGYSREIFIGFIAALLCDVAILLAILTYSLH